MEEKIILKRCHKCGQEKPMTAKFFFRHSIAKDGFDSRCKECASKLAKLRRLKNPIPKQKEDKYSKGKATKIRTQPVEAQDFKIITPEVLFLAVRKQIAMEFLDVLKERFGI